MEFESPDVERDFPGLYASEAGRRSNESDFSDESHEKLSKKDLLIGKRKDKKDKKDRGYATLEGESSPEEETDMRSPSKVKKLKPFKFSSKKEKREKSREKETKEKEGDKEKKKTEEKEKEKKKEVKVKLKFKEKKKDKKDDIIDVSEDLPIFGVPLSVAVERSKCHDGVDIPLVVRNCIDHVQEVGLTAENVYKVSGIKSRVQQVKKMYNNHELVHIADYDLPVATSLLKLFLRELPEPILTSELLERFEEAGAIKEALERGERFKQLVKELPNCNRTLLSWILVHLDQVTQHDKYNKMNAQAIGTTLSPLLQVSQRLLTALLCHVSDLFPDVKLIKYVPPLKSVSPGLPDTPEGLALELSKQESLLAQLHREMAQGLAGQDRVEQLWSVQRTVTHLKRMLRSLEKSGHRSLDDMDSLHCLPSKISPGEKYTKINDDQIPEEKSVPHTLTIPPPPAFQNSVSAPSSVSSGPNVPVLGPQSLPPTSMPSLSSIPPPMSVMTSLPPVASVLLPPAVAPHQQIVIPPLPPPVEKVTTNRKTSLNFQGYDDDSPWTGPCKLTAEQKSATIGTMRGRMPLPADSTNPWQRRPPLVQQEETIIMHKQVPTAESLEVQDINKESTEKADRMQRAIIESEELMNLANKLKADCETERAAIAKLKEQINLLGGIPELGMLSDDSDDEQLLAESELSALSKRRQELNQEANVLQTWKKALVESIAAEQEAIVDLKVQIKFLQLSRT